MIRARNVAKQFQLGPDRVEALRPVDLDVARGEFLSIIGPSGCGKSTLLVAIVSFFPVMAGTMTGLASVEKNYRDLATLLRLSPLQRFRRVEIPFALPAIFVGLRIATTQAMTAAVIGELMGATYGLGYLLSLGQENNDAGVVIAAILMLCAMGWALHELVRLSERRILFWHESRLAAGA